MKRAKLFLIFSLSLLGNEWILIHVLKCRYYRMLRIVICYLLFLIHLFITSNCREPKGQHKAATVVYNGVDRNAGTQFSFSNCLWLIGFSKRPRVPDVPRLFAHFKSRKPTNKESKEQTNKQTNKRIQERKKKEREREREGPLTLVVIVLMVLLQSCCLLSSNVKTRNRSVN